jgi:hypothetical protein
VTINYGKGKPIYGGTFKIPGRMKKKDFYKKHSKEEDNKQKGLDGSTTLIAKRDQ